jgi:hypothetical protein
MAGSTGGAVVLDLVHASGDAGEHSEERWRSGGQDHVGACPASAEVDRIPSGRQPAALRRGTEKNRVRGFETRRRLVQLHCYEGKRLVECARDMGLSYGRVLAVWHRIVEEVSAEGQKAADLRRDVRAYSDRVLRHLIEKSLPLARNSAAHGMVTLKALESLCRLHGVTALETAESSGTATLDEVGAAVRVVSPILAEKIERVRALRSVGSP